MIRPLRTAAQLRFPDRPGVDPGTSRKVAFLTGTRADFGKLKPLIRRLVPDSRFEVHVFVTGMHMLSTYGSTVQEVEKEGFPNIHKFINQNVNDGMDHALAKTISGLSDYVRETKPDLLVVHGDRIEALAGATVGALNDILVGHIEGGEVSGTVDESLRHAVSKLAHLHFVCNEEARLRLLQLGERPQSVHVIGSPDVDLMNSPDLPTLGQVRERFEIPWEDYGILLFHPVTTEFSELRRQVDHLLEAVLRSQENFVVIYPNNDKGSGRIMEAYEELKGHPRFRVFPSMRFEYFLTLLREARLILGNSSAGVREAPHYGTPAVNVGTRQNGRVRSPTVLNVDFEPETILAAMDRALTLPRHPQTLFGDGRSAERFHHLLASPALWATGTQKVFVDQEPAA